MQLDEMHIALVSLAVHLLNDEHFVVRLKKNIENKDGLVNTVLGRQHSHGKRWNEPQVWQLHTKLC